MLLPAAATRALLRLFDVVWKWIFLFPWAPYKVALVIVVSYCSQLICISGVTLICIFRSRILKRRFKDTLAGVFPCWAARFKDDRSETGENGPPGVVEFKLEAMKSMAIMENMWDREAGAADREKQCSGKKEISKNAPKYMNTSACSAISNPELAQIE